MGFGVKGLVTDWLNPQDVVEGMKLQTTLTLTNLYSQIEYSYPKLLGIFFA